MGCTGKGVRVHLWASVNGSSGHHYQFETGGHHWSGGLMQPDAWSYKQVIQAPAGAVLLLEWESATQAA